MIALFAPTLFGILMRHGLTALGAFLVAQGYMDASVVDGLAQCFDMSAPADATATTVIGGVTALAGLLWSGGEKVKRKIPTG